MVGPNVFVLAGLTFVKQKAAYWPCSAECLDHWELLTYWSMLELISLEGDTSLFLKSGATCPRFLEVFMLDVGLPYSTSGD